MDIHRRRLSDERPDATRYDTTGFDLRNTSDLRLSPSHRHVLTYGLEYFHDRQRAEQHANPYLLFPDADADTVSMYLQDEVSLGERVFLIPALRWDRFHNETAGQDKVTNSQLSPKVGGVFRVTDFLHLEANYAEGFRSPAFQNLYISGTHFPGAFFLPNPELKPERSRNVDVGFRLRNAGLLGDDDHAVFKFAYFRNRVYDFIDSDSTFNPPNRQVETQFVNVQKALIQGIEAESRWVFMTGLDVWASYTDIRGDDITGKNEEGPSLWRAFSRARASLASATPIGPGTSRRVPGCRWLLGKTGFPRAYRKHPATASMTSSPPGSRTIAGCKGSVLTWAWIT